MSGGGLHFVIGQLYGALAVIRARPEVDRERLIALLTDVIARLEGAASDDRR